MADAGMLSVAALAPRAPSRPVHPVAWLLLILPFGAGSGYVSVTLAYQLSQAGVDAAGVGSLIALTYLPQSWKFLWAPVADSTLGRKSWYLVGATLTASCFGGCAVLKVGTAALPLLTVLVVLQSVATTFIAMSVEGLITHNTLEQQKGRASGWFQAGNLGGNGVGGGVALWIAQHAPFAWLAPCALGAATLACTLPLLRIAEPPKHVGPAHSRGGVSALARQWATLVAILKDVWSLVASRRGFLALLVVFLPLGTGAASNMWSPAADFWHASADTVALVNGTLGGFVSMAGCMVAGRLLDRLDRKTAYLLFGAIQGVILLAMAVSPRSQTSFALYALAYAFANGLSFAAYSAVVLEVIGLRAAASQFNVYSSLSNMPIGYMTFFEGHVFKSFGPSTMMVFEALVAAAAIGLFIVASRIAGRAPASTTGATA